MSCDISTYCTALVEFAAHSDLAVELGDHPAARKADDERDKSLKWCRSGPRSEPIADESKSKGQRHRSRSCTIADSTHIDPQYVWGDEGPVND